jgi:thiamine biosynthesis lipoprotein
MNCDVSVQLETEADGMSILQALPTQVEAIEATLSRFRSNSELMSINAQAGQWTTASPLLFENILAAKHAARLTDGLFNPLVLPALLASGYTQSFETLGRVSTGKPAPAADWRGIELRSTSHEVRIPEGSALDLGGIAKGWTAMRLADELATHGPCLVNLGGDIVARGMPQNRAGWEVSIEDPFTHQGMVDLCLHDVSIVTSGVDFRRWTSSEGAVKHHIIDPTTGEPADTDILTASVVHPHAPTAEAYAKAVLLMGSEAGLAWLDTQWNSAGMVILKDGTALATSRFTQYLVEKAIL